MYIKQSCSLSLLLARSFRQERHRRYCHCKYKNTNTINTGADPEFCNGEGARRILCHLRWAVAAQHGGRSQPGGGLIKPPPPGPPYWITETNHADPLMYNFIQRSHNVCDYHSFSYKNNPHWLWLFIFKGLCSKDIRPDMPSMVADISKNLGLCENISGNSLYRKSI